MKHIKEAIINVAIGGAIAAVMLTVVSVRDARLARKQAGAAIELMEKMQVACDERLVIINALREDLKEAKLNVVTVTNYVERYYVNETNTANTGYFFKAGTNQYPFYTNSVIHNSEIK